MVSFNNAVTLGEIMFRFLVKVTNEIDQALQTITNILEFLTIEDEEQTTPPRTEYPQIPPPPNTPTPDASENLFFSQISLLLHHASVGDVPTFYHLFQEIFSSKPNHPFKKCFANDTILTLLTHIQTYDTNVVISLHQLGNFIHDNDSTTSVISILEAIETAMKDIISKLDIENINSLAAYSNIQDFDTEINTRKAYLVQEDLKEIAMETYGLDSLKSEDEFCIIGKNIDQDL